jgi:hypothetical protein
MLKKSKIEKECESLEADMRKIAEEEIKKIEEIAEKNKKEAEKTAEEIEDSLKGKKVKSKKTTRI